MSPTTSESKSRAEEVRRRLAEEKARQASRPKPTPKPATKKPAPVFTPRVKTVSSGGERRRFNVAFGNAVNARVQMPSIPKVEMGARWISLAISVVCAALLYVMWAVEPFVISTAETYGNQRVTVSEINSVLGWMGVSSVEAMPEQGVKSLQVAFPEFSSIDVQVIFPAKVVVTVTERVPVISWMQNGQVVWLDADGVAFTPRGAVEGLIPVDALAPPPALPVDAAAATEAVLTRRFVSPETILALQTLAPNVPAGSVLLYDPKYGLGWRDVRGWQAYFGQTVSDIPLKLQVYQGLVDWLLSNGMEPEIISVEHPHAPYYRLEQ